VAGIRCVLPARALLGEGPLWDPEDHRLYWVDIKGCSVHRFDPATGHDTRWPTPETVGSLVRRAAGGLVVALRSGFHFLDLDTGAIQPIARPELDRPENPSTTGSPTAAAGSGRAACTIPGPLRRAPSTASTPTARAAE